MASLPYQNSYEEDNGDYYDETDNGATDTGIKECPVAFMDSSLYYFPSTSTMHRSSNLDFGVICQPLTQEETPLVNFNETSVIRCRSCRAYINPFIEWVSNGIHNHWICNLCGISNEITNAYFKEKEEGLRKELQFGSVEIVAPDEYCVRPPQFPAYLFVINVNKQLIESNILINICETIKQVINDENNMNDETQIGFITYSHRIHYYSIKPNLTKPKMIVINDINDALLPIPWNRIMTNLSESRELINHLLTILPSLHKSGEQTSNENALGTAVECAFAALQSIGGKIICFSFGLPSLGKGKVMNRSNKSMDEYDKLLKRSNNFYMDLAISLTKHQISCDLFQMTCNEEAYCDISTIKGICRCSGGELFYYDKYSVTQHEEAFCADLYKLLTRPKGWESVMRIRVSKGLSIKNYYGCFYRRSADLLSIPTIDSDKAVTILLCHKSNMDLDTESTKNDNNFLNTPYVYVQSALLYTNSFGQRRIRCCTKRIAVTSSYDELFNNINLAAMTAVVAKQAVFKMLSKDVASSRMFIQDSCISALQSYCKYCGINNGLKTEEDYPFALRYWPLNTLGLLKCCAFADVRDVSNWVNFDQRVATLIHILHLGSNHIELLVRPSLYRIDDIIDLDDEALNDEYYLPSESPLTLKTMSADAIYALDNGQSFVIRVGKNVDAQIMQYFINNKLQLQQSDNNKYITKLYSIFEYLQSINYKNQSIEIISETQSEKDKEFRTIYLIRDRTESVMSYDEFLNFIYKQTKPKLQTHHMLFQFKTPRTRDWAKYLKKLQKFLDSNEATAHLSAFLLKAQETRLVLVKLLDECAKDVSRPDDIIKILNDYLPILEQLIEGIDANTVKLIGYLDVVWTSFLMNNINGKSLSNTLKWEKICCYSLLALAHYQKAVNLHHLNRQISHKTKEKVNKETNEDFDPIFDEPTDLNKQKPQIYDDQNRVKEISKYLKQAASIWSFTATLFPVLIVENGKNAYDVTPETFECVISVLSTLALINAQEFMIQLAVQTNKSHSLTAKLSCGVSDKLKKCNSLLKSNLSNNVYNSIKKDFVLYLKIRSDLYKAIALKYNAKLLKQKEKHGESVAYYQSAINILKHAQNKFPNDNNKNKNVSSSTIVIKKSINKQTQSVKALCNAAQSENNSVYFEVVPKADQIEPVASKFVIKVDKYEPNWQDL